MTLPPLATPDDIAARLGRQLTPVEQVKAPAMLRDFSAQVRRYCRRDFYPYVQKTQICYIVDSEIQLERPVVTGPQPGQVIAIGGGMGLPDVPITWFTFDGIDRIKINLGHGIINLPEIWFEDDMYPGTARVTYDFGYAEVPDEVVSVIANAAIGFITAPTQAAGVIGETIGPYSWRGERTGSGAGVALAQADLNGLSDFRNKHRTLELRLR